MSVTPPTIAQLAFCSDDLPRTAQLYGEAFGFADAGAKVIAGEWLARIQGLGDDAATTLAWQVGRQDFLQLEFFHHTDPPQRRQPADWRPSDLGWARWGLTIPDFSAAIDRLAGLGVTLLTEPIEHEGLGRACFKDPHTGVIVEVMEDGAAVPGGVRPRFYDLAPAVVYAAISVPDLDRAGSFLVDTVGLVEDSTILHTPEMEALWGLGGARREALVLRGGDIFVEVLQYADPPGAAKPDGYQLSDQGFMNIAVGYRDRPGADALLERLRRDGYSINADLAQTPAGGTYASDRDGNSLEILSAPREYDQTFGFVPLAGLLREPGWPQASVPPVG